jgi:hypothetical protein
MSWEVNSPIKFRLGTIAIWNRLTKRVVDLRDPTLGFLSEAAPILFKDLVEAPRPVSMGDHEALRKTN